MTKVGVVGAGYVGATTAACLAHLGHDVVCGDRDAALIEQLGRAQVPILEAQLPELITEGLAAGRLSFAVGARGAAEGAEVVFLCVNTPQAEDGTADLRNVEAAVSEIAEALAPGAIVVNKSTMPIGSAALVRSLLEAEGVPADGFEVAVNPEFLQEGTAVREFLEPARIVLGVESEDAAVRLSLLYRRLQARIIVTDPVSAEMVKYASNAYLATRISFINSVANLCEAVGANVDDVALGMGHDPRIGFAALRPGPGYGGSCLPKDTAALLAMAEDAGYPFEHLRTTVAVNEAQRERTVEKIRRGLGGVVAGHAVGILGLTFKAGTDDLRDSPALDVALRLLKEGAVVRAYDPAASEDAVVAIAPDLEVVADPYAACAGANALVVLTEWDQFRWLDFDRVETLMTGRVVIDARNLLDGDALRRRGFVYEGMGRR